MYLWNRIVIVTNTGAKKLKSLEKKTTKWGGRELSVFVRVTVCNLFLLAKIWYVMQVLHCSRLHIQKMHRIFAVFVWNSGWERTSRSCLFRTVRSGGVNLCHIFLRQIVNRFLFLRDTTDEFLRTFFQVVLPYELPEFVVSSVDDGCYTVTGYLKEVVSSVGFLGTRFSFEYLSTVSRKCLLRHLREMLFAMPIYRSLYREGPGQYVLSRVKRMVVPATVKTFSFKLHTGTLPVKTWMEKKGLFVAWSTQCILCKRPESIENVFLECWDATFFWDVLQRTLKKDLPLTAHGIRFLSVDCEEGLPYDTVMLLGLHAIWRSRMAVRHADIDAQPVRSYFVHNVCTRREVYRIHCPGGEWLPLLDNLVTLKEF